MRTYENADYREVCKRLATRERQRQWGYMQAIAAWLRVTERFALPLCNLPLVGGYRCIEKANHKGEHLWWRHGSAVPSFGRVGK